MSYRFCNALFQTEKDLAAEIASSFLYGGSNSDETVAGFDVDESIEDLHRHWPLDDVSDENDIPLDRLKSEVNDAVRAVIAEARSRTAA